MENSDPSLEKFFRAHKDTITSVSFSPTGKQIASGAYDSNLIVWNLRQNQSQNRSFRYQVKPEFPTWTLKVYESWDLSVKPHMSDEFQLQLEF